MLTLLEANRVSRYVNYMGLKSYSGSVMFTSHVTRSTDNGLR